SSLSSRPAIAAPIASSCRPAPQKRATDPVGKRKSSGPRHFSAPRSRSHPPLVLILVVLAPVTASPRTPPASLARPSQQQPPILPNQTVPVCASRLPTSAIALFVTAPWHTTLHGEADSGSIRHPYRIQP
ncbi:hypothetical protein BKA66DRAFT_526328, partial [Pyrenochaeta sp. MPI-SDFR-AT-0127]